MVTLHTNRTTRKDSGYIPFDISLLGKAESVLPPE